MIRKPNDEQLEQALEAIPRIEPDNNDLSSFIFGMESTIAGSNGILTPDCFGSKCLLCCFSFAIKIRIICLVFSLSSLLTTTSSYS